LRKEEMMEQANSLKDFLDVYGPSLAKRVNDELEVIHDPLADERTEMDNIMDRLNKKPFPVQREVVKGVVKSFKSGNKSVYITAEMGSGKTLMGIASALLLKENPRVLILCPPHLVRKWIAEIKEAAPASRVFNLNGKHCLSTLEALRSPRPLTSPEFYVLGRERAKTTFQWRPAVVRKKSGNFCPRCGGLLLDIDETPLPVFERNTQGKYKKKYACRNMIAKWEWDAETGRHRRTDRTCGEQLWQPDLDNRKYRKYMPALFIKNKLKNFFDVLIADEIHQYKNLSGQGYAFAILSMACKYTLGLTGTLMGGYASDLFYLIYRTHPEVMLADDNPWNNLTSFMDKYGVIERITTIPEEDGLTVKSKKRTIVKAKPGVSPLLMGKMLLSNSVFLRLADMSENLPEYEEEVIELKMNPQQGEAYHSFEEDMKNALKEALAVGDNSLLGAYLNALLSYPDRIYQGVSVYHPHTHELVAFGPPIQGDMPKEKELLRIIEDEISKGRKVLVYIQNSNTTDISPRFVKTLEDKGYRVKVLRSGNTEGRSEKIDKWVKKGLDVLICNPKLVETGLDLLAFASIVFYQCGYSTYTLRQASRRSWRITQKNPVKVYYLTYSDSMQTRAMKLIATKLETSLALEGELTDKGLSALSESSDSMSKELARALLEQIDDSGALKDLWAAYRKKEVQVDCNVSQTTPIDTKEQELPAGVEKVSVEAEQIGDKVIKVSFIEYVGRRKKVTRVEVKKSELDKMIKEKGNLTSVQLCMF
jgi:SNF2 family DNA or RNA helicase